MAYKHVCVSFDYDHDKDYYHLLEAWNCNSAIDFHITDCTPTEIQSYSVEVIKQVLSRKIGEANYMIAIIGRHSCDLHRDAALIGYRNWQSYEIAKNLEKGNKLVVVQLDGYSSIPYECKGPNVKIIRGFNLDNIKTALDSFSSGWGWYRW